MPKITEGFTRGLTTEKNDKRKKYVHIYECKKCHNGTITDKYENGKLVLSEKECKCGGKNNG